MKFSDEEIMNCYPPTKEQFLNAFRDIELLNEIMKLYHEKKHYDFSDIMILITKNKKGD